jgi:hypothetical protein
MFDASCCNCSEVRNEWGKGRSCQWFRMTEKADPYQEEVAAVHLVTSPSKTENESFEEERAYCWMFWVLQNFLVVWECRLPDWYLSDQFSVTRVRLC